MFEPKSNIGAVCPHCAGDRLKPKAKFLTIPLENFIGSWCKLKFTEGSLTEYMWVKVNSVDSTGTLQGVLDNDPVNITSLVCGSPVAFTRDQIIDGIKRAGDTFGPQYI